MEINLNGKKMNVIETASVGVVNENTHFIFTQNNGTVTAEYNGGKILKGFLVGTVNDNLLAFTYCQKQVEGNLDYGESTCEVKYDTDGKILLVESFEWKSRPGEKGVNIFKEL